MVVVVSVVVVGAVVEGNKISIGLGKGIQDCDNVQYTEKISSVFKIMFYSWQAIQMNASS